MGLSDLKVAALTNGTRGDVQPYLALARGLIARGHETILGGPRFKPFARGAAELGVPYSPLGPAYDRAAVARTVDQAARGALPLRDTQVIFTALEREADGMFDDCLALS